MIRITIGHEPNDWLNSQRSVYVVREDEKRYRTLLEKDMISDTIFDNLPLLDSIISAKIVKYKKCDSNIKVQIIG